MSSTPQAGFVPVALAEGRGCPPECGPVRGVVPCALCSGGFPTAGNKHLRRALYMPALVAIRHQPHLRGFYDHLLARGKTKMQALVAVMRKLLHAIFGMFKHHQTFDGSKVYALLPAIVPEPATQEVA